jgi:hypothetical protein
VDPVATARLAAAVQRYATFYSQGQHQTHAAGTTRVDDATLMRRRAWLAQQVDRLKPHADMVDNAFGALHVALESLPPLLLSEAEAAADLNSSTGARDGWRRRRARSPSSVPIAAGSSVVEGTDAAALRLLGEGNGGSSHGDVSSAAPGANGGDAATARQAVATAERMTLMRRELADVEAAIVTRYADALALESQILDQLVVGAGVAE